MKKLLNIFFLFLFIILFVGCLSAGKGLSNTEVELMRVNPHIPINN